MAEEPLDVLVVEDNPGDIRLIRTGFDRSDVEHSITHVGDGEEAMDALRRRTEGDADGLPDLLMLDLNVPKVTGRDVLERIEGESELASIPVLVLTGSQADDHVLETHRLGADGYFVKPVDPHEFIALVQRIARSIAAAEGLPRGEFADLDRGA